MSNRSRFDGLSLAVLAILMVGAWSIYDATSDPRATDEPASRSVEVDQALEASDGVSASTTELGVRSESVTAGGETAGSAGDVLGPTADQPSAEVLEQWKNEAGAIQRQLLEAMVSGDPDALARAREAAAGLASRHGR